MLSWLKELDHKNKVNGVYQFIIIGCVLDAYVYNGKYIYLKKVLFRFFKDYDIVVVYNRSNGFEFPEERAQEMRTKFKEIIDSTRFKRVPRQNNDRYGKMSEIKNRGNIDILYNSSDPAEALTALSLLIKNKDIKSVIILDCAGNLVPAVGADPDIIGTVQSWSKNPEITNISILITDRLEAIDPALNRDNNKRVSTIEIPLPGSGERKGLLQVRNTVNNCSLFKSGSIDQLTKATHGKQLSEIENMVNDCLKNKEELTLEYIERYKGGNPWVTKDKNINNTKAFLKSKIIGQDRAIETVIRKIKIARAGLASKNRPKAVLLFVGPSGVGKTELVKLLSRAIFDNNAPITLNMSEFDAQFTTSKLLGAPPGYVGYDDGGLFAKRIKERNGYAVILIDELEKADGKILDLFLSIFDEGQCTDSSGKFIDFTNSLIIITSNLGHEHHTYNLDEQERNEEVQEALEAMFRPEFLGRLEMVMFDYLDNNAYSKISKILIEAIKDRLYIRGKRRMVYEQGVINYLIKVGTDVRYGARRLRQTIDNLIGNKLADMLLEDTFPEDCTAIVKVVNDQLVFKVD